jgi:hypothetical protein
MISVVGRVDEKFGLHHVHRSTRQLCRGLPHDQGPIVALTSAGRGISGDVKQSEASLGSQQHHKRQGQSGRRSSSTVPLDLAVTSARYLDGCLDKTPGPSYKRRTEVLRTQESPLREQEALMRFALIRAW